LPEAWTNFSFLAKLAPIHPMFELLNTAELIFGLALYCFVPYIAFFIGNKIYRFKERYSLKGILLGMVITQLLFLLFPMLIALGVGLYEGSVTGRFLLEFGLIIPEFIYLFTQLLLHAEMATFMFLLFVFILAVGGVGSVHAMILVFTCKKPMKEMLSVSFSNLTITFLTLVVINILVQIFN